MELDQGSTAAFAHGFQRGFPRHATAARLAGAQRAILRAQDEMERIAEETLALKAEASLDAVRLRTSALLRTRAPDRASPSRLRVSPSARS